MIVVEVGHARVITFLPLSCELSVLSLSLSFFSFSAVMRFLFQLSHLHPAARQFCRSTYTITDITIK
jgi:hypothetical protein